MGPDFTFARQSVPEYGISGVVIWQESWRNLKALGRRSLLAMSGIAIGCASVVAFITTGHNAAEAALSMFTGLDVNVLSASFTPSAAGMLPSPELINIRDLKARIPGFHFAAPVSFSPTLIRAHGQGISLNITGTTAELADVLQLQTRSGRFLSPYDAGSSFVVLGSEAARMLSQSGMPLITGSQVEIAGYLYQVIGILKPRGRNPVFPAELDKSVLVPLTVMRKLTAVPSVDSIIIRAKDVSSMPGDTRRLHEWLSATVRGNAAEIQVPQQLLEGLAAQSRTFSYMLMALACISLLSGGLAITNIMVMSVSARRKEIGLRMALGARPRDIRSLFISEALSLALLGTLAGTVAGMLTAWLFVSYSGWHFFFAPWAIPLGVISSLTTGLFAGWLPADKAARTEPVRALRDD